MEKTTTKEFTINVIKSLIYGCNNIKIKESLKNIKSILIKSNELSSKIWISKKTLLLYINSNSFGYRDNGFNVLDADELIKEIEK